MFESIVDSDYYGSPPYVCDSAGEHTVVPYSEPDKTWFVNIGG